MLPDAYVIIWDGQSVGIDSNSGGYPHKTNYPGHVYFWADKRHAEVYMKMWPDHNWKLVRLSFVIHEI